MALQDGLDESVELKSKLKSELSELVDQKNEIK